jgi:hypothetical protein
LQYDTVGIAHNAFAITRIPRLCRRRPFMPAGRAIEKAAIFIRKGGLAFRTGGQRAHGFMLS